MTHQHRCVAVAAFVALLGLAACATPTSRPDGSPWVVANIDVDRLPPDAAIYVSARPGAAAGFVDSPGLTRITTEDWAGMSQALLASGYPLLLETSLPGIDSSRPIVAGLMHRVVEPGEGARDVLGVSMYGVVPDIREAPTFIHGRMFVPATDSSTLRQSVGDLFAEVGIVDVSATPDGGMVMAGRDVVVVVFAEAGVLRVEVAQGPGAADVDQTVARLGVLDTDRHPRARTAAWRRFVAGHDDIAVHLSSQQLGPANVALNLATLAVVLPRATADQVMSLYSSGVAQVLGSGVLMHPDDSAAHGVTLALGRQPDGSLDLAAVRALYTDAATAHQRADDDGGATFAPASGTKPIVSLRIGSSIGTLVEQSPGPWGMQGRDLVEVLQQARSGGTLTLVHLLSQWPWHTIAKIARYFEVEETLGALPDSVSLIIERLAVDEQTGEIDALAAASVDLPATADLTTLRDLLGQLQAALGSQSKPVEVFSDIRKVGQHHRVQVGIGAEPSKLLNLDEPKADAGLTVVIDPSRLPAGLRHPLAGLTLPNRSTITVASRFYGSAEFWRISLGTHQSAAPDIIDAERAPERSPPSRGRVCLRQVGQQLQGRLFEIARMPAGRRLHRLAEDLPDEAWSCAEADPSTAELAKLSRTSWTLLRSRLAALSHPTFAHGLAVRSCANGRLVACELADIVAPPWSSGELELPVVVVPAAAQRADWVLRLDVTANAVYAHGEVVAHHGPDRPISSEKILEALGRVSLLANRPIVGLAIDRRLPWKSVKPLVTVLDEAGVDTRFVLDGGDTNKPPNLWPFSRHGIYGPDADPRRVVMVVLSRTTNGDELVAKTNEVVVAMSAKGPAPDPGLLCEASDAGRFVLDPQGDVSVGDTVRVGVALSSCPGSEGRSVAVLGRAPRASVSLGGKPEVTGALDARDVLRNVQRGRVGVKDCYETLLTTRPEAYGTVELRMDVDSNGTTTRAQARMKKPLEAARSCIEKAMLGIRFPPARTGGKTKIALDWVLRPGL